MCNGRKCAFTSGVAGNKKPAFENQWMRRIAARSKLYETRGIYMPSMAFKAAQRSERDMEEKDGVGKARSREN
jgi:hypothetical protein